MSKNREVKQGSKQNSDQLQKRGGYRPVTEGYQPVHIQKGYQANDPQNSTNSDNLPQGGTGQSDSNSGISSSSQETGK